jgi:hypothetical protein
MTPDDDPSGRGELIAALILSVACLALVLWITAVSSGDKTLYAATSGDLPDAPAAVASQTRAPPGQ